MTASDKAALEIAEGCRRLRFGYAFLATHDQFAELALKARAGELGAVHYDHIADACNSIGHHFAEDAMQWFTARDRCYEARDAA